MPSKKVQKLVLDSMTRFAEDCHEKPFYYTNPVAALKPCPLPPAEKKARETDAQIFSNRVERNLSDANARRITRYREHGLFSSTNR